jgi:glycolate oxidase
MVTYMSDGLTLHQARPDCVVYPTTTEEVAGIVKVCNAARIPFVARGAGTGLSGGAIIDGGVIIQMSRLNRIVQLDPVNRHAVVQAGVVNNYLSMQCRPYNLEFAPDPSSAAACTIGGNVAENAGGPHTLKYGVTSNHILGQTIVMPDGEILRVGNNFPVRSGPDFSGFLVGSEGTIAITTEISVRLTPIRTNIATMLAIFSTVEQATETVTGLLAAGVLPAALEMIDNLCIQAVEAHLKPGFPTDAGAILLIELDGQLDLIEADKLQVERICRQQAARDFLLAKDEEERQRLWRGRKSAVGTIGKISPAFYTNDGVVPRSQLTRILKDIYNIGDDHKLRVGNLCHAGDGNIHPLILFDHKSTKGKEKAIRCSQDILQACLDLGGSLSGEHGIGIEKLSMMEQMYTTEDMAHMTRLRDEFNPDKLLNPGKIFPTGGHCGELNQSSKGVEGTRV